MRHDDNNQRHEWIESVLSSAKGFTPAEPSEYLYQSIMHRVRAERMQAGNTESNMLDAVSVRTIRMALSVGLCVLGMNCWALWSWATLPQVTNTRSTDIQQQTQTYELNPNFNLFTE